MTQSFGTYELIRRIGKGGMAEVFLARSIGAEGLEKQLVIKKILPRLASSDRFVEMFIQEAKVAMGLNHPNIVQVYDFGKVGRDYYLAMEYVDGVELSDLISATERIDESLSIGDAVYVAAEVARGLDYLHRRKTSAGDSLQLVHRDISPQNLMISWDGAVKIVDFGIASSARAPQPEADELRGKYRYMSPEEARGESVDPRSDLFSLATVLFELLCGRRLFRGEEPRQILDLVQSAVVPDISRLNPDIPERLEHALYKALSSNRQQRFDDARSFQVELTRVLHGMPEIHDAATIAGYITRVDEQLSQPVGSLGVDDTSGAPVEASAGFSLRTAGGVTTPALEESGIGPPGRAQAVRQRKTVTVVAGKFHSDSADRPIRETSTEKYRHVIKSLAYKNDAVVEHLDDTEFVLLLGIPVSDQTDAHRAVRMALELEEAFEERSIGFGTTPEVALVVTTGEVVFQQGVESPNREYDWGLRSESRRRIRGLVEHVESTGTVTDSSLVRRIQRTFDCQELDVDGKRSGQSQQLYRIGGEKTASTRIRELRRSLDAFYGREIPRRRLRNNLRETVLQRRARALIFVGSPGVGKSMLVEEFLRGLNRRDVRVIRGVASSLHRDVPLASAVALITGLLELDADGCLEEIKRQLQERIEELFANASQREREWLVESLSRIFAVSASDSQPEQRSGPGERRRHIFAAIRRLMNRLARGGRPLVLAVDDIHHVDPVMLAFAAEYFDRSQRVPVFLVGTGRDTGAHADSRAWNALMEARNIAIEQLGELPASDAQQLIRHLLAAQGTDSARLVEFVYEQAGGNPLYIREVIDTLVDDDALESPVERGRAAPDELLPPSLEGLIRARIDRLDVEHREVLKKVALLPTPFDSRRAEVVCGPGVDDVLDELVDAGMLRVDAGRETRRYLFADAVTREVASRRMMPEQARQFHGVIANFLLEQREGADSALIARHLDEAGRSSEALEMYEEAAQRAFRQFGADECLRICDRIIEHPDAVDDRRFRALQWKCRALERLGDHGQVEQTLEQLEKLAPQIATSDERAQVALRRTRLHLDRGQLESARRTVKRARELANNQKHTLELADAWRLEAVIEMRQGNRDRALALIDRAIASLNVGGNRRERETMIEAYSARGVILRQSGRHHEALEAYDTALAAIESIGSTTLERRLLMNSGLALAYIGEFSEARRRYQRSLDVCRRLGHRGDEALVLVNLGHLYQILGRYDRAISCVRRGIVLGRRIEATTAVADGKITLGVALVEKGEFEAGEYHLEKGLELARARPNTYLITCALMGLANAELQRGNPDSIRRSIQRAERMRRQCEEAGMVWGIVVAEELLARGADQSGRSEEALEHSRRALEMLDEVELLAVDEILVTHIELLEDRPQFDDERRNCIERVVDIYQRRLEAIDDEENRRAYENRPVNQTIRELADELKATRRSSVLDS